MDGQSLHEESHPMLVLSRPIGARDDVIRTAEMAEIFGTLFNKPTVRRFGRYIVLGTLGRGGMGTVLKGYDEALNRQVAIKVLHSDPTEHEARRLKREAKALARLSHPNVVPVFEVAEVAGQVFVAMALVNGKTLKQWQDEEPCHGWKECVQVYLQAGYGLAAAHAKGLVHRDFKPGNAIIDQDGQVRVLDFGLARSVGVGVEDESSFEYTMVPRPEGDMLEPKLTRTGQVVGTPAYMPLEQLDGKLADARSDQFSFCVSLYEAVYRERPFEGRSLVALASSIAEGRVQPAPAGAKVPAQLRAILLRGLAAKPESRWYSMEALLVQLRKLVVPRARRWALSSLAVGVLGLGGGLVLGDAEEIERCRVPYRRLTGIWDEERRQEVHAALLRTELPYALRTGEWVDGEFNRYAREWVERHTEVCEASVEDERGERDRRLRLDCLWERSRSLKAAVDVLSQADASVLENAVALVVALPGFDPCDDLDALRSVTPPPEGSGVRREVEELRDELVTIEAVGRAGATSLEPALERVDRVMERSEAMRYWPLWAEAKSQRGILRSENGQYEESENDLRDAHEMAMKHRNNELTMDTAQRLAYVVGYQQVRYDEGRAWGQVALAHAKRSRDEGLVAMILDRLGTLLHAQGQYEEALRHHEEALRIRESVLGTDHPYVADSLSHLAYVLRELKDYAQAKDYHERALHAWEEILGSKHPYVANSLRALSELDSADRPEE